MNHLKGGADHLVAGVALASCTLLGAGAATAAQPDRAADTAARREYAIPPGLLVAALEQFTRQSGVAVAIGDARISQLQSSGARGSLTEGEALSTLLEGTGFTAAPAGNAWELVPAGSSGVLSEVVVEGFRAREQGSATKTALSIRETPQAISVITRESMEARHVTDITSALELAAGLTSGIAADGGPFAGRGLGGGEGFMLRGQQLDGRRDVRMDGFVVASRAFDMVAFERIEVVKGPSSVLYGQGSLGGFINLIRRKPQAQFQGSLATQLASWDSRRAELDFTGPLDDDGRLRGRITAAWDDSGSFTEHVQTRSYTLAPGLYADLGSGFTLKAQLLYQDDHYTPSRGTPLRRDGDELFIPDIDRSLFTGVPSQEKSSSHVYLATMELDKRLDENWLASLQFQKSGVNSRRFFDAYSNACCLDTSGNVDMYSDTSKFSGDSWAGELRLDGRFSALGRDHRVLLGLEAARRDDDLAFGYTSLGPGNLYTQQFQQDNIIPGGARYQDFDFDFSNDNRDLGVYGQLLLSASQRLRLLVGARYDWSDIDHLDNNSGQLDTKEDGELTMRFGATYEVSPQLMTYGVYAQTFNPTVDARSGSGQILDPETGEGFELGVKSEWFGGQLGVNAAVFRQELDNIPIPEPGNPDFSISGGLQRTDGLELEVSGRVGGLTLGAAATFLDSKYIDERDPYVGLAPYGLIKQQASLFVSYELQGGPLNGLSFGATLVDVGQRRQTDFETFTEYFLDGYTRADINVAYRGLEHWDLSLQLRNVTDERYIERLRDLYQDNFFGAPRAVLARAEYRF